jgi:hypothetical protein
VSVLDLASGSLYRVPAGRLVEVLAGHGDTEVESGRDGSSSDYRAYSIR